MFYGSFAQSAVRRTAFTGPKMLLDVVDDIKKNGRTAFLVESHIDITKGKAFDAWLHRPYRFTDAGHAETGPTGGGPRPKQSYSGTGSLPRTVVGLTHRRVTSANRF